MSAFTVPTLTPSAFAVARCVALLHIHKLPTRHIDITTEQTIKSPDAVIRRDAGERSNQAVNQTALETICSRADSQQQTDAVKPKITPQLFSARQSIRAVRERNPHETGTGKTLPRS